jgi:hypothetical protein
VFETTLCFAVKVKKSGSSVLMRSTQTADARCFIPIGQHDGSYEWILGHHVSLQAYISCIDLVCVVEDYVMPFIPKKMLIQYYSCSLSMVILNMLLPLSLCVKLPSTSNPTLRFDYYGLLRTTEWQIAWLLNGAGMLFFQFAIGISFHYVLFICLGGWWMNY